MATPAKLRNIGPKSAAQLRQVGVRTLDDLRALGSLEAFVKLKRAGFKPSLNLLYALEGAIGLPVFAGFKSGFMLASFGYVLGFIAAAYVVGYLAERGWDRSPPRMFAAMLLGAAVLYVPGLLWLSAWIGAEKAIALGLVPFIAGDVVKAAVAALGFPAAWALLGRR